MFDKHKIGKQSQRVAEEPRVSPASPAMNPGINASAAGVAMIGKGIRITGEVKADCALRIEGRVEGRTVQCADELEIAESGEVTASIIGKVVKISGLVSGDIGGSEKVTITRSGRVQGNIVAPRVQLEDGALFRGSIDMTPAKAVETGKPVEPGKSAVRPAAEENNPNAAAAAPAKNQAPAAQAARKEPGLNLKSG